MKHLQMNPKLEEVIAIDRNKIKNITDFPYFVSKTVTIKDIENRQEQGLQGPTKRLQHSEVRVYKDTPALKQKRI